VCLVDISGFDDTHISDAEILHDISSSLNQLYRRGILLSGVIHMHKMPDKRERDAPAIDVVELIPHGFRRMDPSLRVLEKSCQGGRISAAYSECL